MIISIDASNIREGGGVTHLRELLGAELLRLGLQKIVIWAGTSTLAALPSRDWLVKAHHPWLDRGLLWRVAWQLFHSGAACRQQKCALLFVPGGMYIGSFRPFIAVAQNLLPFGPEERSRYGFGFARLRLHLLEYLQCHAFRRAAGVVYMTEISRRLIEQRTGIRAKRSVVVHHGVSTKFSTEPRAARPLDRYTPEAPFRWLYVSMLYPYKHQCRVAEAAGILLRQGLPLELDFVGPGSTKDAQALNRMIHEYDPSGRRLRYRGRIGYEELSAIYQRADALIFASSCDTFGMIILEAMAAGLPVACSSLSSLPEVAGDAAFYFDPLKPGAIGAAMERFMCDPGLRADLARRGHERAKSFTWERCASETFSFLAEVASNACQKPQQTIHAERY